MYLHTPGTVSSPAKPLKAKGYFFLRAECAILPQSLWQRMFCPFATPHSLFRMHHPSFATRIVLLYNLHDLLLRTHCTRCPCPESIRQAPANLYSREFVRICTKINLTTEEGHKTTTHLECRRYCCFADLSPLPTLTRLRWPRPAPRGTGFPSPEIPFPAPPICVP